MPRYVFNLIVGDQTHVIDHQDMEINTLHEVHTTALRVLEHARPSVPDYLRPRCRISITLPSGQTVLTAIPPELASGEHCLRKAG